MRLTQNELVQLFHEVTTGAVFRPIRWHEDQQSLEGRLSINGHMLDATLSDSNNAPSIGISLKLGERLTVSPFPNKDGTASEHDVMALVTLAKDGEWCTGMMKADAPLIPGVDPFFQMLCDRMFKTAERIVGDR